MGSPGPIPYYTITTDGSGNYFGNPACIATAGGSTVLLDQLVAYGCYAGPGFVIAPPAPGTFGNMRRDVVYGPGFVNLDMSIIKHFTLGERFRMELRGEVFNILNHPNFAGVTHDLSDAGSPILGVAQYTPDIGASNPVIGSGGSRHIQLGVKIIW